MHFRTLVRIMIYAMARFLQEEPNGMQGMYQRWDGIWHSVCYRKMHARKLAQELLLQDQCLSKKYAERQGVSLIGCIRMERGGEGNESEW